MVKGDIFFQLLSFCCSLSPLVGIGYHDSVLLLPLDNGPESKRTTPETGFKTRVYLSKDTNEIKKANARLTKECTESEPKQSTKKDLAP